MTPVVVGTESTSRSVAAGPPSGNSRRPRPQHQRVDQEDVPVDQVAPPQRLDQLAAAQHRQVLARLLLEPGHGLGGVALQQGGVPPGERPRSVVDATYLRVLSSTSVKGLSVWLGQKPWKSRRAAGPQGRPCPRRRPGP